MSQAAENKPKILVIGGTADIDQTFATLILGKLLAAQFDTNVEILLDNKDYLPVTIKHVVPQRIQILDQIDDPELTIAVDKGDSVIKEVRWDQAGDKLNILIFTDRGQLNSDKFSTDAGKVTYTHIYAVGIENADKVKALLGKQAGVWDVATTHLLHNDPQINQYAMHNYVFSEPNYLSALWQLCIQQKWTMDSRLASEVVSGIYLTTDNFTNDKTNGKTIQLTAQMVAHGAHVPPKLVKDEVKETAKGASADQPISKSTEPSSVEPEVAAALAVAETLNGPIVEVETTSVDSESNQPLNSALRTPTEDPLAPASTPLEIKSDEPEEEVPAPMFGGMGGMGGFGGMGGGNSDPLPSAKKSN